MNPLKLLCRRTGRFIYGTLALAAMLAPLQGFASSLMAPGDLALRHDIQLLAEHGVITSPITSWPLSWRAIDSEIAAFENRADLPPAVATTMSRVAALAESQLRPGDVRYHLDISGADEPIVIRGFANTPREEAGVSAGVSWLGEKMIVQLTGAAVEEPNGDTDYRMDGTFIGITAGNYTIGLSTLDRWWGPGWDGSLILSNNARSIPSFVIHRNEAKPFKSKWLSWIGPWDMSFISGQLEENRHIPEAKFFGLRINFKPHPSLEIGLSRSAQWCGQGRPCGLDTFTDMFLGKDNRGDDGLTADTEPGNQLAGLDFRWTPGWFDRPMAFYGQFIAEDEAGGFPSRYMAMGGMEVSGALRSGSWRWFAELAGTSCDFLKEDIFNCAYNHGIYQSGYRYRGRVIGHGADNDAKLVSTGLIFVGSEGNSIRAVLRAGPLNRVGNDSRNSIARTPTDLTSVDISHGTLIGGGLLEMGMGYERLEDKASGEETSQNRFFLRWKRDF